MSKPGSKYVVCVSKTRGAPTLRCVALSDMKRAPVTVGVPAVRGRPGCCEPTYGRCAKSATVPDRRIDVWANQTHKSGLGPAKIVVRPRETETRPYETERRPCETGMRPYETEMRPCETEMRTSN